jgi:hypothetical protein
MRASKQFATDNGPSHHPSHMVHVTAETRRIVNPDGPTIVILELERRTGDKPTYVRVRMNVDEARALAERLTDAASVN